MSVDRREFQRLCDLVESHGWRVELSQHNRGNAAKVRRGSHAHAMLIPPDPQFKPVPLSVSGDPGARTNIYSCLRRAGVEADPRRAQQAAKKARRRRRPG